MYVIQITEIDGRPLYLGSDPTRFTLTPRMDQARKVASRGDIAEAIWATLFGIKSTPPEAVRYVRDEPEAVAATNGHATGRTP